MSKPDPSRNPAILQNKALNKVRRSMDARANARLSVKKAGGVGLAGMAGWGDLANSGIVATPETKKLLREARNSVGCVRISVANDQLIGSNIKVDNIKKWGDRLDSLVKYLPDKEPIYFVLYKDSKSCLLVTFIPDECAPLYKMIYASTKNAVKDAILDLDEECDLEEFNVEKGDDLSYKEYEKKSTAPKPYSEAELIRMEQDNAETAGAYGTMAHLMQLEMKSGEAGAKPIALPGMSGKILAKVNLRPTKAAPPSSLLPKKKGPVGVRVLPVPVFNKPKEVKEEKEEVTEQKDDPVDETNDNEEAAKLDTEEKVNEEEIDDVLAPTPQAVIQETDGEAQDEEEIDNQEEETAVVAPVLDFDDEAKLEEVKVPGPVSPPNEAVSNFNPTPTKKPSAIAGVVTSTSRVGRRVSQGAMQGGKKVSTSLRSFGGIGKVFGGLGRSKNKKISDSMLASLDDSNGTHTYAELRSMKQMNNFGDLDVKSLEQYLSDREFAKVFNMQRADFSKLAQWKKEKMKQSVGLF